MPRIWQLVLMACALVLVTVAMMAVGAPAPTMFGGFVTAAGSAMLLGVRTAMPAPVNRTSQAVLGSIVATQIDADAWGSVRSQLPAVLLVSIVTVLLAVAMGQTLRYYRVSPLTAVLASVPGGASSATAIASDLGADERVVVVVQYLRVVVVIVTLPVLLAVVFDASASVRPADTGVGWIAVLYVTAVSGAGLAVGRLLRLPAPGVVGALAVGVVLGLTPAFDDVTVPVVVQLVALLVIGLQAGSGFDRAVVADLRQMIPLALVTSGVLVGICALVALPFARWTGASPLDAYLATSPGGLPVVLATSLDAGGDPALVSVTQVVRLMTVLLGVPLAVALVRRCRK